MKTRTQLKTTNRKKKDQGGANLNFVFDPPKKKNRIKELYELVDKAVARNMKKDPEGFLKFVNSMSDKENKKAVKTSTKAWKDQIIHIGEEGKYGLKGKKLGDLMPKELQELQTHFWPIQKNEKYLSDDIELRRALDASLQDPETQAAIEKIVKDPEKLMLLELKDRFKLIENIWWEMNNLMPAVDEMLTRIFESAITELKRSNEYKITAALEYRLKDIGQAYATVKLANSQFLNQVLQWKNRLNDGLGIDDCDNINSKMRVTHFESAFLKRYGNNLFKSNLIY